MNGKNPIGASWCIILVSMLVLAGNANAQQISKIVDGSGGGYAAEVTAANALKVDASATISGGTITVSSISSALPAGTNTIGKVTLTQGGVDAIVNANGSLTVAGVSAAGAAPVNPPISVSGIDGSGLKRHLLTDTDGTVRVNSSAANGSGSAAAATVSTVTTLAAPANAVGFILMNLDTSTTNIRWAIGRTASATLGQQLQPGRDTGFVPAGANISIVAESGTNNYDVQWVTK